ncbi:MAG: OmpA family protein [Thiotrichaceae bacterium]
MIKISKITTSNTVKTPSITTFSWFAISCFAMLSGVFGLSGCSTNDQLYAKYDKNCDLPPATVKIMEKVKFKDRIVYKDKVIYKDKVVYKNNTVGVSGMPWEPAVYFGFDLSSLSTNEEQRLATDAKILMRDKRFKVNIQSFTDTKGSNAYNKRLALRRQATVVKYLTALGIAKNRITVSPLGEELPLLGSSEHDRAINRRVELMLLDETGRPLALKIQQAQSGFTPPSPVR